MDARHQTSSSSKTIPDAASLTNCTLELSSWHSERRTNHGCSSHVPEAQLCESEYDTANSTTYNQVIDRVNVLSTLGSDRMRKMVQECLEMACQKVKGCASCEAWTKWKIASFPCQHGNMSNVWQRYKLYISWLHFPTLLRHSWADSTAWPRTWAWRGSTLEASNEHKSFVIIQNHWDSFIRIQCQCSPLISGGK